MLRIGHALSGSDPNVHAAVASGDRRWVEALARRQLDAGADLVDVGAATFGDDEEVALRSLLEWVEALVDGPLCIDAADPDLLLRLGSERRHPPLLNSFELGGEWPDALGDHIERGGSLVVQLRDGADVPDGAEARAECWRRARARTRAFPIERVWFDAVALPWGDDLDAGRGLLEFLDALPVGERARVLLGLSNISYGHPRRGEIHRLWYGEFASRGVGALLLDPFDPALRPSAS